jgi:Leucine-rich repeat (LRR) protein
MPLPDQTLKILSGDIGYLISKYLGSMSALLLYSTCKALYQSINRKTMISQMWIKIQQFPINAISEYSIRYVQVNLSFLDRLRSLDLEIKGIKLEDEFIPDSDDSDDEMDPAVNKKRYHSLRKFTKLSFLHINNPYSNRFDFLQSLDLEVFKLTPDQYDMPEEESHFAFDTLAHMEALRKVELTFCKVGGKKRLQANYLDLISLHRCVISSLESLHGVSIKIVAIRGGKVPEKELSKLYLCETLILSNVSCRRSNFLSSFERLKHLELSYTGITEGNGLRELNKLHEFISTGNRFQDLWFLIGWTNIESLQLNEARIDNLEPIGYLMNLKVLRCNSNLISDVSSLAGLHYLYHLELNHNRIEDLSPLRSLGLRILLLNRNQIKEISVLSSCKSLKHLELAQNKVTSLNALQKLPIEKLVVSRNQIRDISVLSTLDYLKMLDVSNNLVEDIPTTILQKIPSLLFDKNPCRLQKV